MREHDTLRAHMKFVILVFKVYKDMFISVKIAYLIDILYTKKKVIV